MNHRVRTRGLTAAALLLLGYAAVTALLGWATGGALAAVRAAGAAPPDAAVALVAALGAWVVLGVLVGSAVVTLVAAAVAGVGSRAYLRAVAITPAAGRRLVGAVLGLSLAAAPLAVGPPAGAVERAAVVAADHAVPRADWVADALDLDRPAATAPVGWSPDRPAAPRRRTAGSEAAVRLVATTPHAEHRLQDEVVVRRGDSLWDIAARHLRDGSDAAEIAAEWPRWYAANRGVIGADPDLLRPGQRLAPPV
jgi:nucleoid-associated protein YgaU